MVTVGVNGHGVFGWSRWVRMITVSSDDHSGFGWS